MIANRYCLSACLVFVAFLAAAFDPNRGSAAVFNPESAALDNGLTVVVVNNDRAPVVTHMVWYRVGAMDEPQGQSGIAHLLEHLMFKGTEKFPTGVFSKTVSRNGGEENAFTSRDYTAYFQNVAKDRLALVMELEADRMTGLVLAADALEREIDVVLEERRERIDNNPSAQLSERAAAMMFLNHPYRRPIIGWEREIAELTGDQVMAFYQEWYAPNNAVLVVAGDVTMADVLPLAEQYYGSIDAVELPERRMIIEPAPLTDRRIAFRDPRVRQPNWSRRYHAPSYGFGNSDLADPLQLVTNLLGGDATSWLYRRLVVEEGVAVSAGAWYDPSRRGPGELVVYASPSDDVSVDALEAAVDAVLSEFITDGPDNEELARSKARLMANAVYARDSLSSGAYVLGEALAIGRTVHDIESWPERIDAVTLTAVRDAARIVLQGRGTVTARLLPASASSGTAIQ